MMYSNRGEYSDRRPHSDRSSKQWGDYEDRWEERRKPYRDVSKDSYDRYDGEGHSRTERTRRSREYSDSPERMYNKDSLSRDWSRKSPVRRRMSSPDWSSSEKKMRRFTEDYEDDYRNRRDPEDKAYRQSPESFSHSNLSNDLKHTLPKEEDFRYKKQPQDSRHRHRHEELIYRKQHADYRALSPCHKERDRHKRSWDCSQERTQSQNCSTESLSKPRERNDDPYPDYEDHCQNRRFPVNGSSEQPFDSDVTNQSPAVPGQKPTKGFQRFLDVLNKGVNVATLTKIVTQTSTEIADQPRSPVSFTNTSGSLQSPVSSARQQLSHPHNSPWSEYEGSERSASPRPHHRSFRPRVPILSDEQSLQKSNGTQSFLSSNSRSRSPPVRSPLVVEKIAQTPEDEHKHRQMQGVLQAIGMDLGFEELGQMSHRIQERLYGKKDGDRGRHHRGSKERDTRRTSSLRRVSRSSSGRSNMSPLTWDYSTKQDSYSAQRDVTEVHQIQAHQAGEFGQKSSSSSGQDNEKCETNSQESSAAYTVSEIPLTPMMPTYSPVNCSGLPYSATAPVLPPNLPPTVPHVAPGLFLPPFLPFSHIPPLNLFPAVLSPSHLLPQHINNSQSPFFNLPEVNAAQSSNATQKSKTLSRPRCLQVIETKQPG